jgi:hypothetical protein
MAGRWVAQWCHMTSGAHVCHRLGRFWGRSLVAGWVWARVSLAMGRSDPAVMDRPLVLVGRRWRYVGELPLVLR